MTWARTSTSIETPVTPEDRTRPTWTAPRRTGPYSTMHSPAQLRTAAAGLRYIRPVHSRERAVRTSTRLRTAALLHNPPTPRLSPGLIQCPGIPPWHHRQGSSRPRARLPVRRSRREGNTRRRLVARSHARCSWGAQTRRCFMTDPHHDMTQVGRGAI